MPIFDYLKKTFPKKVKKETVDEVLASKDKEQISQLVEKEVTVDQQRLDLFEQKIKIEKEITAIQLSTRVSMPIFASLHNTLRMKYQWYYKWHMAPFSSLVHWLTLSSFSTILVAAVFTALFTNTVVRTFADSRHSWDTKGAWSTWDLSNVVADESNSLSLAPETPATSGGTVVSGESAIASGTTTEETLAADYAPTGTATFTFTPWRKEVVDWLAAESKETLNGGTIKKEYSTDNILFTEDIANLADSETIYIRLTFSTIDPKISPVLASLAINYSRLPYAPEGVSFESKQVLFSTSQILTAGTFIDPDNDDHAASQWQITTKSGDYTATILDQTVTSSDTSNLTSLTLKNSLDAGNYFARARYEDSKGAWSLWSQEASFTVVKPEGQKTSVQNNGTEQIAANPNEILADRTDTSKTIDNKNGTKTLESYLGTVHYKEDYTKTDSQWLDINPNHSVDTPGYVLFDQMPSTVKVFKDKIGYEIESRATGAKYAVTLKDVDGNPVLSKSKGTGNLVAWADINTPDVIANKDLNKNVFAKWLGSEALAQDSQVTTDNGNLKFEFQISQDGVRLWKTITGADAPKNFKWDIAKTDGTKEVTTIVTDPKTKERKTVVVKDDLQFRDKPEAFNVTTTGEIVKDAQGQDKVVPIEAKKISGDMNSTFTWQETAPKSDMKIDTDVIVLRPNVDYYPGLTPSSGSTNYEMIDEVVADDDATYLSRFSGSGMILAVGTPSPNVPAGATVNSLTIYARIYNAGAMATASFGGGQYTINGSYNVADANWTTYSDTFTINPWNGGTAFTVDEINTLDSINLVLNAVNGEARITQLYTEISYSGAAAAPTVTTSAASAITSTDATLNGNVTDDGGASVTNRGFYLATDQSAGHDCTTITSLYDHTAAGSGTGVYSLSTGAWGALTASTYYCSRSWAYNGVDMGYGAWTSFQTLGNNHTLTYNAGSGGSIVGTSPQTVADGANGSQVTATPSAGYYFVNWSDANTTAARTDTNVTANITVTANFALQFLSRWDTSKTSTGSSTATQIHLPLESTGTYNFVVDWGDSNTNTITTWNQAETTHTYASGGIYDIKISGTITGFRFNSTGDRLKLSQISQFGPLRVGNSNSYFNGTNNLKITATDNLNMTGTTDMSYAFAYSGIDTVPSMNSWNTAAVTNMSNMFAYAYHFNQNIGSWNTAAVTNMSNMFISAGLFNQNIGSWNTAAVTDMGGMFLYASAFNQNIGSWNTAAVTDMQWMFYSASAFNQNIGSWNTAAVTDMNTMFYSASTFNQNLASWNVANVTYMANMFDSSALSTVNYSNILIGWSAQAVKSNVALGAAAKKYTLGAAADGRAHLISAHAWTITDGGPSTFVLTYNAGSGGSIVGTSPQTVADGANGAQVTATPSAGYYFVNWSDANTTAARTDTNVTADVTVTANFALQFLSRWDTTKTSSGSSTATRIHLPLESTGTYNFVVDWGDSSTSTITTWNQAETTHTYASGGIYDLKISGTLTGFRFNDSGDKLKLSQISQFGPLRLGNSNGYFNGTTNLKITAVDNLTMTGTTTMQNAFASSGIDTVPSMNSWDMSAVTTMYQMFMNDSAFNQNIGSWNVANVISMHSMFDGASVFNQNIGSWNTAKVTDMYCMFSNASAFNQNIGNWNTGAVTNMTQMFGWASAFNQNISSWNTAAVTSMDTMFYYASAFNQNIGNWNTGAVTNMSNMFAHASAFNQNLAAWNVANVTTMTNMFNSVTLSTVNYSNILVGWSAQAVKSNVAFSGGSSKYTLGAAADGRAHLISAHTWTITDGGPSAFVLTYNAGSGGSVAGSSPQTIDYGANGTLVTATPAANYHFVKWSDNNSTTATRTDTNITATITTTATFAIDTRTLTYNSGSNGSVIGTTPQTVDYGANGSQVTATPAANYHFVSWSDAYPTAARTDLSVTANVTVSATFAIDAPASPSGITITPTSSTTFNVTWTDNSSIETGFKVYTAAGNADCSAASYSGTPDATPAANAQTQGITSKSVNTQYCAKVVATNSSGDSAPAYSAPKYTLANVPTFTTVAGDYSDADKWHLDTTINASANPAGTNYYIQYSTNDGAGAGNFYAPNAMAWQTDTSYLFKKNKDNADLSANTQYWMKVKARNGDGVETTYTSTSVADVTPPAAPTDPSASNVTASGALISWTAVTGANKYTFSYGTDSAATNVGTITDIATTSTTLSSLNETTKYYFKIQAISNANGTGPYSDPSASGANFTTVASAAPTAPTDFDGTTSTTSINWTWSDSSSTETGYKVENVAHTNLSTNLAVNTVAWNETSLSPDTAYTRHVNIWNGTGGNDSNSRTLYTLANTPAAPTVTAVSSSKLKIVINQNGNSSTTRYAIYNSTASKYVKQSDHTLQDAADWQTYADWGGVSGFENWNLTKNTSYSYTVKALNGDSVETLSSAAGTAVTLNNFQITVNKAGNGAGDLNQSSQTLDAGSNLTTIATPVTSSNFTSWTGCDSVITTSCTLSNIAADKTITATFSLKTFTINSSAGTNGSISPLGDNQINYGTSPEYSITPSDGYYISNIVVDGAVVAGTIPSSYTFTNVTAAHTIAVSFVANNTCIWDGQAGDNNWSSADNWTGNIIPSTTCDVVFDGTSTKNSTLDAGFASHIKSLSVNAGYSGTISANTTLNDDGDFTLNAGTFTANAQTLNISGSLTMAASPTAVFNKGASTINFNPTTTGKTITTNDQVLGNLIFNETGGGWTLQDNLTATTLTVTTGTLTDNGKTVTVNGNISIGATTGTLTSTGTWIQSASGNISNPTYENGFGSLIIAGTGVTTTLTGHVAVGLNGSASGRVTMGPGTLNGGGYLIANYARTNDSLTVNNLTMGTALSYYIFSPEITNQTQKAITLPNGFVTGRFDLNYRATINLTATGDFNLGNNSFNVKSDSAVFSDHFVDMGDHNLTCNNLILGHPDALADSGYLKLGSGTHTITGSISQGNAVNVGNQLDLGSGTINVGGNWDSSLITVTPGTSTVDLTGSGTVYTKNEFYNLKLAHNGQTTTVGGDVYVKNLLYTYSGGTLSTQNSTTDRFYLELTNGDPIVDTGAAINANIVYDPTQSVSLAGHNFGGSVFYRAQTANLDSTILTMTLISDITGQASIYTYDLTLGKTAILDFNGHDVTAANIYTGIGNGTSVDRVGNINFGSGNFTITGNIGISPISTAMTHTMNLQSSNISVGGNIDFTGIAVTPGTSAVILNGTGNQTVSGSNTFNNLSATASSARTISFASGTTQTINGILSLNGSVDGNLKLNRLDGAGTDQWNIDPKGTKSVSYLSVENSKNLSATVINPANSINLGNTDNWFLPSGAITFSAAKTNQKDQTLALTTDTGIQMKISNSADFTDAEYELFAASKVWTLDNPTVDGTKTVYAKLKDIYGNESATISASIVLDATAPAAPAGLTATAGNTSVSLSWINPKDADFTTTVLYRSTKADFTPAIDNSLGRYDETLNNKIASFASDVQTYFDANVVNGTTYYYKLRAIDAVDNYSVESNQVSGKADNDLPTAPTTLTLSNKTNAKDGMEYINVKDGILSFYPAIDLNSGVKNYIISIGTTSNGTEVLNSKEVLTTSLENQDKPSISFSSISPSIAGLADGTYYIRVQAADNLGNLSSVSTELKFMIDTVAPVISGEVNATDVSNRSASLYKALLTWPEAAETGSGLIGYVVKKDGEILAPDASLVTGNIQYDAVNRIYSYLDNLGANKSASYTISAVDFAKNESTNLSAKFNGTDATTVILPEEAPGEGVLVITEPKATPSDSLGEKTMATITWKTSVPATSQILYGESTDYALTTDLDLGLNSFHTIVLSDLKYNTTYHFVVISKDRNGNEVRSDQVTEFKDLTFVTKDVLKDQAVLDTIIQNLSGSLMKVRDIIANMVSRTSIVNANQSIANSLGIKVENVPTAISTVAISIAAAAAAAAPIANAMTLFSLPEYLRALIYSMLSLGTKRKRKEWGRVAEDGTDLPIAQAKISLFKLEKTQYSAIVSKKLIETVYSDNDGNYAFIAGPGEYEIVITKDMYHMVENNPKSYKPGSVIIVKSESEGLIVPTVQMSMTADDTKKKLFSLKRLDNIERVLVYISLVFLIFGTITVISGLAKDFTSVTNLILLAVYPFLWYLNIMSLKKSSPFGNVVDKQNSQGVPLSLVRVMSEDGKKLIKTTVTNQAGKFQTLVQKGQYQVKVAKVGYLQAEPVMLDTEQKIESLHERIEMDRDKRA